jgi:hypothetical protein
VVKAPGVELDEQQLFGFFEGRMPKWWRPDAVHFVESLPLGATGMVLKNLLRGQYRDIVVTTSRSQDHLPVEANSNAASLIARPGKSGTYPLGVDLTDMALPTCVTASRV